MTQENRELLIKDLCARMPYGVKCSHKNEGIFSLTCIDLEYNYIYVKHGGFKIGEPEINHKHIKPYLFPMSSMTMDQAQQWHKYANDRGGLAASTDWLNAHHFDYRGLIEKGLAIDATNLNIY